MKKPTYKSREKKALPPMIEGTLSDLFERQAALEKEYQSLLVEAGKRLEKARKGVGHSKLQAILGLSRTTYHVAENPRTDKPSKRFSLQRVAEIHSATVRAVRLIEELEK